MGFFLAPVILHPFCLCYNQLLMAVIVPSKHPQENAPGAGMTAESKPITQRIGEQWQKPRVRRWGILGIALGTLTLMGFYAVLDAAHLAQHALLDGADWLGYAVCHRLTEHSLSIAGRQLPLCARCTGMYLGVATAVLFFWLKGRARHTELPPLPILLALLALIGLMGLDGVNSFLHFFPNAPHLYEPKNWLRLLTGMGTGLAMGSFVFPALAQALWRRAIPRPMLGTWWELGALLLGAGIIAWAVLSNQPVILYVMAVVSTVGLLATLGSVNVILGLILLRRDGRATRWRETAVPLILGTLLAIIELSAISVIRFNLTGTMIGLPGL